MTSTEDSFDRIGNLDAAFQLLGLPPQFLKRNVMPRLAYDGPSDALDAADHRAILACTARSGSSLISVALERYDLRFQEYLNPKGHIGKLIDAGATTTTQLARALADSALHDGRIAIKMPHAALSYLVLFGEIPQRADRWKFIYLRRENIVRQAISSIIAERTGQWTHVMERRGEIAEDDYDFDRILTVSGAITQMNRQWERFFGLFGIDAFNVTYEEFVRDQAGTAERMARFLGVDVARFPAAAEHEPWIKAQSTDLNRIWEERFREDLVDRARLRAAETV